MTQKLKIIFVVLLVLAFVTPQSLFLRAQSPEFQSQDASTFAGKHVSPVKVVVTKLNSQPLNLVVTPPQKNTYIEKCSVTATRILGFFQSGALVNLNQPANCFTLLNSNFEPEQFLSVEPLRNINSSIVLHVPSVIITSSHFTPFVPFSLSEVTLPFALLMLFGFVIISNKIIVSKNKNHLVFIEAFNFDYSNMLRC